MVLTTQPASTFATRELPRSWAKTAFFEGVTGWTDKFVERCTEMTL
jgi:hypothetical protein